MGAAGRPDDGLGDEAGDGVRAFAGDERLELAGEVLRTILLVIGQGRAVGIG